MQPNPFLTVLKIAFTAILAFLVFLAFTQSNHLQDQIAQMKTESSGLRDRVGDMSRKLDDAKSKLDRLSGTADEISKALREGVRPATSDSGGPTRDLVPTSSTKDWGWDRNAGLDVNPDPHRPTGTPGRYRNFLELDPDPEYPAEAAAHEGGTLSTPYGDDPKGWNLLTENAAELQEVMELYCADAPAGSHFANPYKFSPAMCWRVEVDPSFREYTLFFRRDVTWHPLLVDLDKYPHLKGVHRATARDYKFTLDMIVNDQSDAAPLRAYFDELAGVELVDEYTCIVRWKSTVWHSKAFTLGRAVMPEFLFSKDEKGKEFPKETIGQSFNNHFYNQIGVCGCGPYRMVSYQVGQWITLERYDDWYGAKQGVVYPIRTKKLLIYSDPETTLLKLQSGEIDMTGLTAGQWKAKVADNKDPKSPFRDGTIVPYKTPRPAYRYIGWKNTHPLFTDKRVRRALALAANRADVAEKVFLGKWIPMSVPVWPQSPQFDTSLAVLPYDPAEAARLLDEAGWKTNPETGIREKDGRRFEFKLTYGAGSPDFAVFVSQVQNEFRAIGVKIELESIEWNIMQKRLQNREFEAVLSGWATNSWDHDFDQIWSSKQIAKPKSSNAIEYSNPELDRLSEDLRSEMDVAKREEKVKRIAKILYEDQPVMFVAWDSVFGGHRSVVKNVNGHLHKERPFQRTFSLWVVR
jgi:peptide/nickel transport system substrate-binding protein